MIIPQEPNLSICAISYNRCQELLDMLKSLKKLNHYAEIVKECIIMNNASTENYEPVRTFVNTHPELRINFIDANINWGVSRGKSKVMKLATGKYLLVVDDDVEFNDENDLLRFANLFNKQQYIDNNTAIINVGIFYHSTKERQITAFPHKKVSKYINKEWFLTSHFIGAAAIFRKDVAEQLNYYRHDIIYGSEEYDIGYRAIDLGYSIAYDGSITVWHKESPKGRVTPNEKQALMWHNKTRIVWSFLPIKYFYTTFILWGLRYLLKSKFDFNGFFKTAKAILKMTKETPRSPLNSNAIKYLSSVEARLWY